MTATGCAPGVTSSDAVNRRPSAAVRPSAEKAFPENEFLILPAVSHYPEDLADSITETSFIASYERRVGKRSMFEIEVPLVTCTGDTAIGRFLDLDFVRHSRVLLVECTFFDRDHRDRAKCGRHIHVDEINKVCEAVPEAQICLIHVTRRTDMRLTKRILERAIKPADRERVSIFMDRPPRGPGTPVSATEGAVPMRED